MSPSNGEREWFGASEDSPSAVLHLAIDLGSRRTAIRPVSEIDWIGAQGNYVTIHLGGNCCTARITLTRLLSRLPRGLFARTHRGYVVNVNRIVEIAGPYKKRNVVLASGESLPLSESYVDELRLALGITESVDGERSVAQSGETFGPKHTPVTDAAGLDPLQRESL